MMIRALLCILLLSCAVGEKATSDYANQLNFKDKLYQEEEKFLKSRKPVTQPISITNSNPEQNHKERLETGNQNFHLPECSGCIIGSSASSPNFSNGQTYVLENAEELGLENIAFDIPVVYNKHVRKWISYFQGKGKGWFKRAAERAGRYAPILSDILHENNMPRDLIYLAFAESGFQNGVRSWAAAVGPWQFIKATGTRYGLHVGWYVDERMDPIKSSLAASKYLRDLHNLFGDWPLAMAGYNAGEGKVKRAIKKYGSDFWQIRNGRYLRQETKDYVPKIMALAIMGKNLRSFGFEREISFQKELEYEVVEVASNSDIYQLSDALNMEFEELKTWNPELLRWQTPSWRENYPLRLPVGLKSDFETCCSQASFNATDFKTLDIKKSASINWLSSKYKVPKKVLANLNGVRESKTFYKGEVVKLPFKSSHNRFGSLYKDLYFKKRRRGKRRKNQMSMRKQIQMAIKKGEKISNPSSFYTVKKGDNLWVIARKTGTSIHTIIKSNLSRIKKGRVYPGQKIIIR